MPLLPSGGTIVIIGSIGSISAPPGMSVYGGTKAAVRAFVRSWIQDIITGVELFADGGLAQV